MPPYKYKIGGSLDSQDPTYVKRQADQDLYEGLKNQDFCYVLNSRQMGKSSLRVRTMYQLQSEGIACAAIDISIIGSTAVTPEKWYGGIAFELWHSLNLNSKVGFNSWWQEHNLLPPVQRLNQLLKAILLPQFPQGLVIFIDEIDTTLKIKFKDDFFAFIRACYNQRVNHSEYQRLSFCLLGVATPSDLIADKNRTPFNIGRAIDLVGIQMNEAHTLAQGLEGKVSCPAAVLQEILQWTGGQPFLTQKICQLILTGETSILPGTEATSIERLVSQRLIENWEVQDEPEHLKTIRDRILRNSKQNTGRLLGLHQQILQQKEVLADHSLEQTELQLTGLVVKQDGKLRTYNRLYQKVFSQEWCEKELAKLRPYREGLSLWLTSQRQDESRLLRGQALQEAQIWSIDKSLSDLDYQFLAASQELEQREVQQRLTAEQQANQILRKANQKASRRIRLGAIVLGVAFALAVSAGLFVLHTTQLVQKATHLEVAGLADIKRLEFDPLGVLIEATQNGEELKALVDDMQIDQRKIVDYPAASPILALQTILDRVNVWQQELTLSGHRQRVNSANFSPDGKAIVTASDDKTARVWNLEGQQRLALPHEQTVNSASFSPDGKTIVTVSGNTARVWNLKGQQRLVLSHEQTVNSASFSPDGKAIVTASGKTARVWNLKGQPLTTLQGHEQTVNSASFSPDGQHIVTASDDETARVWDLKGGLLSRLEGYQGRDTSVSFSPDGQHIVTASDSRMARVWDLKGHQLTALQGHEETVNSASFSPREPFIVTAAKDNTVRVWDFKGQQVAILQHGSTVNSASFSPDRQHIVTASDDKRVRVWEFKGQPLATLQHESTVNSASFSPDGQHIVTASYDKEARVWDLKGQPLATLQHESTVNSAGFSPDGHYIVTASDDKTARVWNPKGQPLATLQHQNSVIYAGFSSDGQYIVTASGKTAQVWNLKGQPLATLQGHRNTLNSASFSPNGQNIVTVSDDKTARVWDLKGQPLATLQHKSSVNDANFSPDGQNIVTVSDDKTARVWDLKGQPLATLSHQSSVNDANFSPDGQSIVTASNDTTAALWGLDGRKLATLQGHQGSIKTANFSPDGQYILTASDDTDKTVRVWDLKGRQLATLQGHQGVVNSAFFSPDGQSIVTASADDTARVWKVERLEQLLTRSHGWLKNYDHSFPISLP
jgi:WD40 repeat protein